MQLENTVDLHLNKKYYLHTEYRVKNIQTEKKKGGGMLGLYILFLESDR